MFVRSVLLPCVHSRLLRPELLTCDAQGMAGVSMKSARFSLGPPAILAACGGLLSCTLRC